MYVRRIQLARTAYVMKDPDSKGLTAELNLHTAQSRKTMQSRTETPVVLRLMLAILWLDILEGVDLTVAGTQYTNENVYRLIRHRIAQFTAAQLRDEINTLSLLSKRSSETGLLFPDSLSGRTPNGLKPPTDPKTCFIKVESFEQLLRALKLATAHAEEVNVHWLCIEDIVE
jgi:hypothetical protein